MSRVSQQKITSDDQNRWGSNRFSGRIVAHGLAVVCVALAAATAWMQRTANSSTSCPTQPITATALPANSTLSARAANSQNVARAIETIRVGERVVTEISDHKRRQAWAWLPERPDWHREPVDPATWKLVEMHLFKPDGSRSDVTLLRPPQWLQQYQAECGAALRLQMPEQGIDGVATIDRIEPCPLLAPGKGQIVTGTFSHLRGGVLKIYLEDLDHPLGVTDNHPLYCVERGDFVHAASLRVGESLPHLKGVTRIRAIQRISDPQQVFNLEVHGEHVYRVTGLGVLAHNTTPTGQATIHRLRDPIHMTVEVENAGKIIHTHQVMTPDACHTFVNELGVPIPADKLKGTAVVELPDAAAAQVCQVELMRAGDLGPYDLVLNSCVTHVIDVLRAGGLEVPPPNGSAQLRFLEQLRRMQWWSYDDLQRARIHRGDRGESGRGSSPPPRYPRPPISDL